ncbi:MAG TPA: hypothetical protein VM122_02250 [Usitatibacter sp.]|nr:hypothetical protein [Usitatibacter sp.]
MTRAAIVLAAVAAASCTALAPDAPSSSRPAASPVAGLFGRTSTSADELVAYLDRIRVLGESALAAEATRQRTAAQRDGSDLSRVKAALALALSQNSEEADILALVDPVARRAAADADLKAVASFLQALAGDRRRLRESATAANAKLRDERRAHEAQKQRADALQERAAQLQQKLDALTEIEKSLSDRQPPGR